MSSFSDKVPLRIGFLHPDLGIGGAERLVVDAARSLRARGHHVVIFTTHHDQNRCFEETRDGTLRICVRGDFLPTHVAQRLRAPCAIARMIYLACGITIRRERFDIFFCDLISHATLPLKLLGGAKIVFYCHFPDQLLTVSDHWLYRIYRWPIDRLEELTTGLADRVLVNSQYTASAFRRAFSRLASVTPEILYPGVDCPMDGADLPELSRANETSELTILSINRYERKKNINLAMEALALMRDQCPGRVFERIRLVIAGGYDPRLRENRETLAELQELSRNLRLEEHTRFLLSCTDAERVALLRGCLFVVYTSANEHFGYVPLEAMAAGRPVVATNSGGPLETVRDGETGLLCAATPRAFAAAFKRLIGDTHEAQRIGRAGRQHVAQHFSSAIFAQRLEGILLSLTDQKTPQE